MAPLHSSITENHNTLPNKLVGLGLHYLTLSTQLKCLNDEKSSSGSYLQSADRDGHQ